MILHRRTFKWLILEGVMVFVGVYLAFLLSEWQEQRRDMKIQAKYYQSLIYEFEKFQSHLAEEDQKLSQNFLAILDEIDQGRQPDLVPPDLYYLYRGPVLSAAFNAKNFESLDLDLLHSITRGTFLLESLRARIQLLHSYTDSILMPALASGKPQFYGADGKLTAGYAWYPKLIREIHSDNRQLHTIVADFALPDLRRQHQNVSARLF